MKTRARAWMLVTLTLPVPLHAQQSESMTTDTALPTAVSLTATEVHPLRSDEVGDDFELWIAHPQAGFMPSQDPPKVLYILDANLFFGTAVEMTRIMHSLYGELPSFLVVGIAYPTDDPLRQSMLRTRDFTPSDDSSMEEVARSMPMPQTEPVSPAMGGAPEFLSFLEHRVIPYIRERFDVSEEGATIFGSSLGGLFVAYAMLQRPGLFENYIAVSPALWWNQSELMRAEPSAPEGTHPKVFLSAGGLEEAPEVPMLAQFRLISNARDLHERLVGHGFPPETTTFSELEGETHTSVVPVALTRGLRALHPRRPPPPR